LASPEALRWPDETSEAARAAAAPYFERGVALERERRFDEAFAAFAQGNRTKHQGLRSAEWVAMHAQGVRELRRVFTADFLRQHASGDTERAPIFIVGLPRSGSTLIEQILATHPDVAGMGEVTVMPELMAATFPFDPAAPLDIAALRRGYLEGIRQAGWSGKPRFTDKVLASFTVIGHIHLMFPRAVILHAMREPADTCLSSYRTLFDRDAAVRFAYDLTDLGRHYRAYREMMDHWRAVLMGRVIDVRHEAVVADPEGQTRRLLEVCGLDWDPRCLRFYDNPREVLTASRDQVRRPIFSDGVGRWRDYRKHLRPLFDALGPYAPPDA
jgi:Sulfotransferase family